MSAEQQNGARSNCSTKEDWIRICECGRLVDVAAEVEMGCEGDERFSSRITVGKKLFLSPDIWNFKHLHLVPEGRKEVKELSIHLLFDLQ